MADSKAARERKAFKVVYGVVERDGESYWTRIGAAFPNKDGSLQVKLDFVPTDPSTSLNIRDPKPRDEEA